MATKSYSVEKITQPSPEQLAKEIVDIISKELHVRVGIGPIWRQLAASRKQEIISKWQGDISALLNKALK